MKQKNTTAPCTNISTSKCVVWSGPTLSCGDVVLIEQGDSLTDTIYRLATKICELYNLDDVSEIDVSVECDNIDKTNLHSLLESMISKLCLLESQIDILTVGAPITYTLGINDTCFGVAGTEYSLSQILGLALPKICTAETNITSLNNRVTVLENQTSQTGSGLTSVEISNITQGNPAVVTTNSPHGFMDGYKILITDVVGMTEVNNNIYYVDVINATQFRLYTDIDLTIAVNSTTYTAYTSGGYVTGGGVYQPPTVSSDCVLFPTNSQMNIAIEALDSFLCNVIDYVSIGSTTLLNPTDISTINSYLGLTLTPVTNITDSIVNSWETIETLITKVQALESKINDCCTFSCKDYELGMTIKYFAEEDTESGIVEAHVRVYFTFEGSVIKPSNFVDSSTPSTITITDQNGNSQTVSFSWDDVDTNGYIFVGLAWADLSGPLTANVDAYFNVMSGDDILASCHKCLNRGIPTPELGCTTCELIIENFTQGNVIVEYTIPSESTTHALYITSNGTYVIPGNSTVTKILNNLTVLESPSLSITYGEGCGLLNTLPSISDKTCYQFKVPYLYSAVSDAYTITGIGDVNLITPLSLNYGNIVSPSVIDSAIDPPLYRGNIVGDITCDLETWNYNATLLNFTTAINAQLIGSDIVCKTIAYKIIHVDDTEHDYRVDIYMIFETYQTNNFMLELTSGGATRKVYVLGEEKTLCDNCLE